jgi:hypothetical protein
MVVLSPIRGYLCPYYERPPWPVPEPFAQVNELDYKAPNTAPLSVADVQDTKLLLLHQSCIFRLQTADKTTQSHVGFA